MSKKKNLGLEIKKLFDEQINEWNLAKSNYDALKKVLTKEFEFGNFSFRVQFNPARIQSSAAKVDSKSIEERKCFLCSANLPAVQRGIPFGKDYLILVNPFPIFPMHLTIPSTSHVDQLIFDRYEDMLDLAESMDEFVIFYNGPKCGASAPDHVHFQAGNKGFLPLEEDTRNGSRRMILENDSLSVYSLDDYLRNVFVIEASDKKAAVDYFNELYSQLETKEGEREPMLNIVSWHEEGKWISCVFPREVHRPECFFAEGESNILISPASVDMGGVFITPQENDFVKITAQDIAKILKEVCISNEKMIQTSEKVKGKG